MEFWSTAVIYQIYPRSFKDTNGDGVGDIKGIIEKLDYLHELGIDAIWISPFYPSPMKDFGYDVSDYCNIDPMFGTLQDFDTLLKEAHQRDIKVMVDYIVNHTSCEHPWFLESRSSRNSPKRDWYIWKDAKPDGSPPNNWLNTVEGSAWEWDEKTKQYYFHSFLKEQPDLNWRNPEVVKAMKGVMKFWLDKGVDGFRVDAFIFMYKDVRFLDEPPMPHKSTYKPFYDLDHIYMMNQPELQGWIKDTSALLKEYGNTFMVLEPTSRLSSIPQLVEWYKADDGSHHAPFNFHFLNLPCDAQKYKQFIDEYDKALGEQFIPTYVIGSHDRPRVATRIGKKQARVAAMLQLTLRGMPTIYNGEEIGMTDVEIPEHQLVDPFKRMVDGRVLNRDPARTPMQWSSEHNAGFTTGEPWLPIAHNYQKVNVQVEDADPHSMLSLYKSLLHLRKKYVSLSQGAYRSLSVENSSICAYIREYKNEKTLVVLNFSGTEQTVSLPFKKSSVLLSSYLDNNKSIDLSKLVLRPYEGTLFYL